MTNDPTSAAYEAIKEKIYPILHRYKYPDQYLPVLHDYAAKQKKRMEIVDEAEHDIFQSIAEAETRGRNMDLTPDKMLLAENKRLREAGDALYEAASYTGRTFDGTHRLLSAAAHYLDTVGKNSGKYQSELQANADGANGRDGEEK